MRYTYPIDIIENIPIAEIEGKKCIIDTGSPFTIVSEETSFCGNTLSVSREELLSEISSLMERDCQGLIGLDQMRGRKVLFDYANKEVTFTDEPLTLGGTSLRYTPVVGNALAIEAYVDGRKTSLIVDTGAKISYIDDQFTYGLTEVDEQTDYYPGIGQYQVKLYDIPTEIMGQTIPTRYGVLPGIMGQMTSLLKLYGISGVIGYDLFLFNKVLIDFDAMTIEIKPD